MENERTAEGHIFHTRAHKETLREKRGDILILRGLRIASPTLGVSGQCDVVEFHKDLQGIPLHGEEGLWNVYPIEYKRGEPKEGNADEIQLCAQAMCLEEMLCCEISSGALFYGQPGRRTTVAFTEDMRQCVRKSLEEMHMLHARGYTPNVKPRKSCHACSLKEICLPTLEKCGSVAKYLRESLED